MPSHSPSHGHIPGQVSVLNVSENEEERERDARFTRWLKSLAISLFFFYIIESYCKKILEQLKVSKSRKQFMVFSIPQITNEINYPENLFYSENSEFCLLSG